MIPFTSSPDELSSGTAIALRTPSAMIECEAWKRASAIASEVSTPSLVSCTWARSVSETRTLPWPGLRCRIAWITRSCEFGSRSRTTPLSQGIRSKAIWRMRVKSSFRSRSSRT